jgi:hypothetical protein
VLFGVLAWPAGGQEEAVCSLGPGGEVPATIVGSGFIQGTPGNDVIAGSPGRDFILPGWPREREEVLTESPLHTACEGEMGDAAR